MSYSDDIATFLAACTVPDYTEARALEDMKRSMDLRSAGWPRDTRKSMFDAESLTQLLQRVHDEGFRWDAHMTALAAIHGNLDCLAFAHEHEGRWDEDTSACAAARGHLDCLAYLHENGCPWNEKTCARAAGRGHLDCLAYAHENGCPWDWRTCSNSAGCGYLDCMAYAYERGGPFHDLSFFSFRARQHLDDRKRSATRLSRACRAWIARRRADVNLVLAARWGRAWGRAAPRPPAKQGGMRLGVETIRDRRAEHPM